MPEEDESAEDDDGEDVNYEEGNKQQSLPGVSVAAAIAVANTERSSSKGHKFIPPIEVELQMQHLWSKEATTLDLVFSSGRRGVSSDSCGEGEGSAGIENGFRMFFVRALAVPPPRFRPPMDMGGFIAEHPQNVYLTKVRNFFLLLLSSSILPSVLVPYPHFH